MDTESPIHGQAFHSSLLDVLHRGSNLRLLVNLRVRPGRAKAAQIEQRGGLQTHQERTHADALP